MKVTWAMSQHFCCDYTIAFSLYPCHLYFINSNKFNNWSYFQYEVQLQGQASSSPSTWSQDPRGATRTEETTTARGRGRGRCRGGRPSDGGEGRPPLGRDNGSEHFSSSHGQRRDCAYALCLYFFLLCHLVGLSTCWIVGLCWPCIGACIQLHINPFY